jgi:hypothetical protein
VLCTLLYLWRFLLDDSHDRQAGRCSMCNKFSFSRPVFTDRGPLTRPTHDLRNSPRRAVISLEWLRSVGGGVGRDGRNECARSWRNPNPARATPQHDNIRLFFFTFKSMALTNAFISNKQRRFFPAVPMTFTSYFLSIDSRLQFRFVPNSQNSF